MQRAGSAATIPLLLSAILAIIGCRGPKSGTGGHSPQSDDKVVNLYTWADYTAPEVLESFEKLTGVKVRVSIFDTNETLEGRMLTGNSGYDITVPTAPFLQRQIRSGAYLPLDKAKLPNLGNLDPAIMARVALNDPGNRYGTVYAWGTYGLGFNERRLAEVLPGVAVNSWRLIFDPAYASKLATCGINMLDAPAGIVRIVLKYLGRNPNDPNPQDLVAAEAVLLKIRPFIRNIDSSIGTEVLANGDVCIALDYNGIVSFAKTRAHEAANGIQIGYVIPVEGSLMYFDMLAIPKDAPHAANAHLFLNYLMDPTISAINSKLIGNANPNSAATPLLDPALLADPMIYPTPEMQRRLFVQTADSPEQARAITRLWQKFKTGQ